MRLKTSDNFRLSRCASGSLRDPRSGLRHISLCHSSCRASLVPSAYALAKRRLGLVVSCNRPKYQ
ncbi:hypothetical protein EHR05_10935 [Leptospira licerasiae]|nr:hypothetical protein EHR05_10935 [Leptospira licerasiae]